MEEALTSALVESAYYILAGLLRDLYNFKLREVSFDSLVPCWCTLSVQLVARSWIRNQIGTIHNKLPLSPVSGFWAAAAGGDAATATHSYAPDHCMYRPNRDIQSNFQDEYVDSGCFWIDPVANTLKEFNHPGSIWKSYSTYHIIN